MTQGTSPEKWPSVDNPQNPQKGTSEGFAGVATNSESTSFALAAPPAPAETTGSKQRGRPFQPGESGNPSGRPRGARNRLSRALLSIVVDDFVEHGAEAIAQLRQKDPATYLRLITSLVPRELILQCEEAPIDYGELSDVEVVNLLIEQQRRKFVQNALATVPPNLTKLPG